MHRRLRDELATRPRRRVPGGAGHPVEPGRHRRAAGRHPAAHPGGWPLYRFAKDAPGDVKGEGVGGTWQAIGVNGKPAAG
ncbi:hypothetical protein [Pseudonocardia sp. T1-2H]|uniref:hypothetical protein n=1 Tax=Pseudonocardia sp. T1-2H TaxID=3128899 RepID=UPI0031011894